MAVVSVIDNKSRSRQTTAMPITRPSFTARQPSRTSQQGGGLVEFCIVALPIMFIGLGSVELSHWFFTRQAISLALLDAGRAAVTSHNKPQRIIASFEHSLRPLYASTSADATTRRLERALADRHRRMDAAPWQIELLSPSASAFADFANTGLRVGGAPGRPAINNDYLAEQHARYRAAGWIDGRGPVSGQTIFEANTAVLRLSWLHEPRVALIRALLRRLGDTNGSYRQRALAAGYLPMSRQIALVMQSHPVQWTDSPDGKVIVGAEGAAASNSCSGWLCNSDMASPTIPGMAPPLGLDIPSVVPPGVPDGADQDDDHSGPGTDGDSTRIHPDVVVDLDDPACGVTLCCA